MSPDSPETRIGQLERSVAKLDAQVEDLKSDVKGLMPLIVQVAEMRLSLARIADTQVEQAKHLIEQEQERRAREREEAVRRDVERRDARRARNGMALGLVVAVLTPAGAIIAAIIQASP